MRLRRFLMTEPTSPPLLCVTGYGHARAHARRRTPGHTPTSQVTPASGVPVIGPPSRPQAPDVSRGSAGCYEGIPQVLVDRLLRHPEGAANPDRLQLTRVNKAVDGHLGHAHDRGDLSLGQEPDLAERGCVCCH